MNRSPARTPKPRITPRRTVQALAVASAVILVSCGDDVAPVAEPATTLGAETAITPPVSAEEPSPDVETEPPPTAIPVETPAIEPPATEPPTTEVTGTEAPDTTPAEPEAPGPTEPSAALTTAGSFGVTLGVPLGSEQLITTEPMDVAVTADDGRTFMQRATGDDTAVDRTPLVSVAGTTELTPLELPGAPDGNAEDTVLIHDVATIDGQVTLLYETVPSDCSNPEACVGSVMTFEPDTGESTEVATKIVWEGGWSGLELASSGLIVGTETDLITNGIFLASTGAAAVPALSDLGLEQFYSDCNVCPFGYTIDPTGQFLGWVDRGEGVDFETPDANELTNQIVVVDISDAGASSRQRVDVEVSAAFGQLDVADIVFGDDGFVNGQAMFQNGGIDADGNPLEPVKVDLRDGSIGEITATSATLNPNPADS